MRNLLEFTVQKSHFRMPNFKEISRVRQCFMKQKQLGGPAVENDMGSSDTCVTKCYSINSRDDLHQSENPSEGPSPFLSA